MTTNLILDEHTARDIETRVSRIHRDLDYRGGKVELADVRSLLKLDLTYYAADDAGLLSDVIHKLKVGAKQVIARPTLLLEAIRKLDLKALFVPDRKQILIDSSLPTLKQRWSEGHEVLHSIIPWHADYTLGDTKATLTPSCHEQIEAEANFGTGRLLFPFQHFENQYRSGAASMHRIKEIAEYFGNTITSTLWRCVEMDEQFSFGVIGAHPRRPSEGKPIIEHLIRSPAFAKAFSSFSEVQAGPLLLSYCGFQRAGPLGNGEIVVRDDSGDEHEFLAETFCNSHHALTLARHVRQRTTVIAVPARDLGLAR